MTDAKSAANLIFSLTSDSYHGYMPKKVRAIWDKLDDELMRVHERRQMDQLFSRKNTGTANHKLFSNQTPNG